MPIPDEFAPDQTAPLEPGLKRTAGVVLLLLIGAVPAGAYTLRMTVEAANFSWYEAVFTAISAVTVTGLALRDPAQLGPTGLAVVGALAVLGAWMWVTLGTRVLLVLSGLTAKPGRVFRLALLWVLGLVLVTGGVTFLAAWWAGQPVAPQEVAWQAVNLGTGLGMGSSGEAAMFGGMLGRVALTPVVLVGSMGLGWVWLWRGSGAWRLDRAIQSWRGPMAWVLMGFAGGAVLLAAGQLLPSFYEQWGLGQTAGVERPEPATWAGVLSAVSDGAFRSATALGWGVEPREELWPLGRWTAGLLHLIGTGPGSATGLGLACLLGGALAGPNAVMRRASWRALGWWLGVLALVMVLLLAVEPMTLAQAGLQRLALGAVTGAGTASSMLWDLTPFGQGVVAVGMWLGKPGALAVWALGLSGGVLPKPGGR